MNVELEYWDSKHEVLIAHLPAGNPPVVPSIGDHADVPHVGDPGTVAFVTVTGRQFYYTLDGTLVRIRLYCEVHE